MRSGRKILAVILAAMMLMSMMTTAMAEATAGSDSCNHHWIYRYPNGKPANCTEWKPVQEYCTECGATTQTWEINGDHVVGSWVWDGVVPNCQEIGIQNGICRYCQDYFTEREMRGNHIWGGWMTMSEPTCTENGQDAHSCTKCGQIEVQYTNKLGHKWGEWVVIQEPQGYEPGIRERKCSRCGLTEREEFYPDGTIQRGDRGDTVKELQEKLNESGHDCGEADGIFGKNTEAALKDWQEENGYNPDGIGWPGQVGEILNGGNDAEETKKYSSGIDLELLTDCSQLSGELGQTISVRAKITNTGETVLTVNSSVMFDGKGNQPASIDYIRWDIDNGTGGGTSWFRPGETTEGTLNIVVEQSDIDAGEIVRRYTEYARPLYCVVDGKMTDVPLGVGTEPEGTNQYTGKEEEKVEDTIEIRIPLVDDAFKYVTVEKSITSTPANGEYYVQDETISFLIKVVIPDGMTITDLEVTDPLKGGNEDAILDILPTATSADNTEYVFSYVVTAEDVERGYVENSACAYFFDPDGDAWVEEWSETVSAPTGGEIQQDGIVLTKSVVSTAEYYCCGDTVTFAIDIANTSDETYSDVIVYDPILEFPELKTYDVMEPGFTDTIEFTYAVTSQDVINGSVENTAFVVRPGGADAQDRIYSNTVSVLTAATIHTIGGTDYQLGGMEVVKSVTSTPANGEYYVPGETITYWIDATNTSSIDLWSQTITDTLAGGTKWSDPGAIGPGVVGSAVFDYVVTPMDAIAGSITNIATAWAYEGEGHTGTKYVAFSNPVTVKTGFEGDFPFGVITEMTIVKEETSTPANGSYYTEGETISYQITYTNTGETDFGETLIYDTLSEGMDEIASAEMLTSGDSRICYFSYVVTADDVAKGYVANSAIAMYDIGGGYINTATSNVVVSDTDGDPNTTYMPGTSGGTVEWGMIRDDEEDTCYIKAVSRVGDTIEYEMHFCTKHAKTQNSILTMAEAADEAGKQQTVWEYAYGLWQKDIEAMYNEILTACDDAAKITVMGERVSHLSMVANTQFALKITNPGHPEEAAHAVADLWMNKCMDMCYLMNTAPSERIDSIFDVERASGENEETEKCTCTVTEEEEGKILFNDRYCAVHAFTYEMMELLLMADESEETWATVRSLWEIELNTAYNALYKTASEEGGKAYLAEYAAYMNWMTAYEMFLNMVYPENPEIVAEVMVNLIMDRALEVCGR